MSVKYQAGSFEYGNGFLRSILRKNLTTDEQIVLINDDKTYPAPDDAAILAKKDIDDSLDYAKTQKFASIDHALSSMGYQKFEEKL